jgi:hypothetical protein
MGLAALLVLLPPAGPSSAGAAADVTSYPTGMLGIGSGQSALLTIANLATTSCRAELQLVDEGGAVVKSTTVTVAPGAGGALTFKPRLPRDGRLDVRAVVVSLNGSCTDFAPNLMIVKSKTGEMRATAPLFAEPFGGGSGTTTLDAHPLASFAAGRIAVLTVSNVGDAPCSAELILVDDSGAVVQRGKLLIEPGASDAIAYELTELARVRAQIAQQNCDALLSSFQSIVKAKQETELSIIHNLGR